MSQKEKLNQKQNVLNSLVIDKNRKVYEQKENWKEIE